ncbi:MAG TPA: MBL fold metallo-hydrolase, partial [Paracoccus sp. (in: a-proteobacteria)]|nr:MBL fold metallo-hydrolase [Paracoccus sp. (in: a-proteobacteria)]
LKAFRLDQNDLQLGRCIDIHDLIAVLLDLLLGVALRRSAALPAGDTCLTLTVELFGPYDSAAAFAGTRIATVDHRIDEPQALDLGGRSLHLVPVPSAHTDTDMIVLDDGSGTLFAGDLIALGLTPSLDGALGGWLNWLATPIEPMPERVVPGHGPVMDSHNAAVAPARDYLMALRDATRAALDAGQPLSRAIPAITAAMQPARGAWADFDATTARNAAAAYAELEWE